MNNKYDSIINKEHHVSDNHKQMSLNERSAQFAPFAALTGYSEAIKETARLLSKRIIIDDALKDIINEKLVFIKNNINTKIEATITFFEEDKLKSGGVYKTIKSIVKKVDENKKIVVLENMEKISMYDIIDIKLEV